MNDTAAKASIGKRAAHELKEFLIIAAYFCVCFTALAYLTAGLITKQSNLLIPQILPSVLIGVPIGAALIRQMKVETFRRICMSFDAWIVGFGVSTVLRDIRLVEGVSAYLFLLGVIVIDGVLLYRFFSAHGRRFDLARTS